MHRLCLLVAALFAALAVFTPRARAGEIHTFLLPGCQVESGLLVDVEDDAVLLMNLDGEERKLAPSQIRSIFVSNTFENPIAQIHLSPALTAALRRVTVGQEEFLGWPVRFVESLVMFYDVKGRIRVHEKDSIARIRPASNVPQLGAVAANRPQIDLKDLSAECASLPAGGAGGGTTGVRPTRILTDQIKVDQYLSDLRRGYSELRNFQERTYLYARPFLFEKATRMSLGADQALAERQLAAPFSFQWSSGTPFHFQSYNRFGLQPVETSANALSIFGFRSDLKAHLFHMHFAGDFRGLAGGDQLYGTENYAPDKLTPYGGDAEVQTGMNYILLMGADFGALSVSVGYYYPSTLVRVNQSWREIKASRRNYSYRVMWTLPTMRFRLTASPFDFGSGQTLESDIGVGDGRELPKSFAFSGKLLRGGFDWDVNKTLQVSLDLMNVDGSYSGNQTAATETFSFQKRAVIASLRQDFGDYVGVRVTGTWLQTHLDFANFAGATGSRDQSPFVSGGQIEFIF